MRCPFALRYRRSGRVIDFSTGLFDQNRDMAAGGLDPAKCVNPEDQTENTGQQDQSERAQKAAADEPS